MSRTDVRSISLASSSACHTFKHRRPLPGWFRLVATSLCSFVLTHILTPRALPWCICSAREQIHRPWELFHSSFRLLAVSIKMLPLSRFSLLSASAVHESCPSAYPNFRLGCERSLPVNLYAVQACVLELSRRGTVVGAAKACSIPSKRLRV